MNPTIQVQYYKGWFDLEHTTPSMVDSRDVALGLSRQARYNGFTTKYYSVAEHSVLMSAYLLKKHHDPVLAMKALIHDASEAYLGDMVTPLKMMIPEFRAWEDRLQIACIKALIPKLGAWYRANVVPSQRHKDIIHTADQRIRIDETNALFSNGALDNWARNNAQELKIDHQPLGVWTADSGWDYSMAEQKWLNNYNMLRSELEHGVPAPGRFS